MNTHSDHCIDICNSLLRGERSAVETYEKALKKYHNSPVAFQLRHILSEHENSVEILEENVTDMGGVPDEASGAWGSFTKAVQTAANLFGADSALEALLSGERIGLKGYEDALDDADVMPECKQLIHSDLLPALTDHIETLDRLQQVT